ncbi:hypothetical protein [Pinibacter aurantiacus]|uniref:Uncharacterized protein n=1 Tax=Pinibacter aurantiacus TaxID=2851599 RepID=A0A9E2SAF9_9BACT|nr:hypothetical protein [Pinibacter aurantiacus]MBV4357614.1 hypothetical protein [Pinibacter aurantiacus]
MESRLIYEANKKSIGKVEWIEHAGGEWAYCGVKEDFRRELVEAELSSFFNQDVFYFSKTRKDSFTRMKQELMLHIEEMIGVNEFCIWNDEFKRVMEFNKIGTFRKGEFSKSVMSSPKYSYLKPGSPDKVKGKLVKYRKGDCLSIHCGGGKYLAVFISEKFNRFYDLTLFDYLEDRKPTIEDLVSGCYFGRYGDSTEGIFPCVEKLMMDCLEVDASEDVERIAHFEITESLQVGSYGGRESFAKLLEHYNLSIDNRRTNTENFNKRPDVFFIGDRLMKFKEIIKSEDGLADKVP